MVSHNGPKNQNHPGLQGNSPWHVFAYFLRVKKVGGPQARPEKDGYGDLSAYTMRLYFKRAHAIKHDLCFGTLFLVDKKAGSNAVEIIRGLPRPSQMLPHLPEANRVGTGKEAPGCPTGSPGILIFRAIVGRHNGR